MLVGVLEEGGVKGGEADMRIVTGMAVTPEEPP